MGLVFGARPGSFRPGDDVVVRSDAVDHHHRTPWFIKGKRGTVRAVSGPFLDPESRAHGGDGIPKRLLYHLEFSQTEVWVDAYHGDDSDLLLVDVYEQWLRPRESDE